MQKSRTIAEVRHLRLKSLLNDLVRNRGDKGGARVWG